MRIQVIYRVRDDADSAPNHRLCIINSDRNVDNASLEDFIVSQIEAYEGKSHSFEFLTSLLMIEYVIIDEKLMRLKKFIPAPTLILTESF